MKKKTKVCWTYKGDVLDDISLVPETAIGFIYRVYDLPGNRYYVGRKNLWICKKSGKITEKESNWKSYNGSSKELTALIKTGVKYKKEILQFAHSKAELTLLESKEIICGGALEDPNSFNGWVSCKIYKKNLIK